MMASPDIPAAPPTSALIVEGGALRGIFSAGVLDGFLEADFDPFHLYLGVSAGATNIAAFLARMHGRNARIYRDYSLHPEFLSLRRFFAGGHFMDLDWLWEITIREIRLDLDRIHAAGKPFYIALTDVHSGKAVYARSEPETLEDLLKASCAMPLLYRGYPFAAGRRVTDGGVSASLPLAEAMRLGATRILVIRSRPPHYRKRLGLGDLLLAWHTRRYPALSRALLRRAGHYNRGIDLLAAPPSGVRVIDVCPPAAFRVSRFGRDGGHLTAGYELGRQAAVTAIASWRRAEVGDEGPWRT